MRIPLCCIVLGVTMPACPTVGQKEGGPVQHADHGAAVVFTSPEVNATQGYATDGTHHYLFSTSEIAKLDADWKPVQSNTNPCAGLPPGADHIGDGAYYRGRLYVPVEHYGSCSEFNHQTLAVYNANAEGLPLLKYKDISMDGHEISSIAIVPSKNALYTSSFCDGSKLWIYDLKTLTLKGTVRLSQNIEKIQGISWNPKSKRFALTADNAPQTVGYIFLVSSTGQVQGPIYTTPPLGELEGVDYTQDSIRYLIRRHVYFIDPGKLPGGSSSQYSTTQ